DVQAELHLSSLRPQDLKSWAPLAVVPQACDGLFQHLVGAGGPSAPLQDLADLTPLAGRVAQHSAWYGLHASLRAALKEHLTVEQSTELHLRAAAWFLEHDYLHEATRHLRLSG
ncbi:unnamed protein product, partial [Laminaria digitata]